MSEEKQENRSTPSEDEQSEHLDEGSRQDPSPDDTEDKCLLSLPPAEVSPIASGSGACSSSSSEGLTGLFKKYSPFKRKDPSKAAKHPCKKHKKESPFKRAKNAFRKTFRRSEPIIRHTDPDLEEKRRRKHSDPTHLKTKHEPKSKRSLFGHFYSSTNEEATEETESKTPKSKKGYFFGATTSKETTASPETKKKVLSRQASTQPSIGAVSVGFFNEGLLRSESSGVPTESSSLDMKSGSSFSPEVQSRQPTITKRRRFRKGTDEDSSFSD